jgi:hypothetical protein
MYIYLYRNVHIGRDACSGNCFALNSAQNNICKNMPIPGALLAKHNMEPAAKSAIRENLQLSLGIVEVAHC